jgi:MFS family permease
MQPEPRTSSTNPQPATASWGAVFALTLCVGTLIASEFMPISLLTPIAADLHVSEGRAGQAIAVSGLFAVLTSLSISSLTRGLDRRWVLLGLTLLMMLSGLMVAFAPTTSIFMAGRALVGVVIGGFWSMSAATVMRLVPEAAVPRAWPPQWRQCAGDHHRGAARELPRPVHRLARRVLRRRPAGCHHARLAVSQPAVDASE